MKFKLSFSHFLLFLSLFFWFSMSSLRTYKIDNPECYSEEYVEISNVSYNRGNFYTVIMILDGNRIKAKSFVSKDYEGNSVFDRYLEWKKKNPKVVLFTSGTYVDGFGIPQGLTIDNGIIINQNLIFDRMDGLVVVDNNGGIVITNLRDGNLRIKYDGLNKKLNIRESSVHLDNLIQWAVKEQLTIFQTHLLAYRDQIKIDPNASSKTSRERRFLAIGRNKDGKTVHAIVHCPQHSSLYDGTKKTMEFLLNNSKMTNIIAIINLDTGAQDAFELHNSDCSINSSIRGQLDPRDADSLLLYYFD